MTNYQKAIIVRKECEKQSACENCKYYNNCKKWFHLRFTPLDVTINDLSEIIKKEKWNVK